MQFHTLLNDRNIFQKWFNSLTCGPFPQLNLRLTPEAPPETNLSNIYSLASRLSVYNKRLSVFDVRNSSSMVEFSPELPSHCRNWA